MEIIVFLIIFWFIYALNSRVDSLQKELFALKQQYNKEPGIQKNVDVAVKEASQPKKAPAHEENTFFHKETTDHRPTKKATPIPKTPSKLALAIQNYFTQGNIVVSIGGVVLFFGFAFLAKYAIQHSTISIETRLFGITLVALALTVFGWRLRKREGYYGLILQGVGIAIFYLVIFSAAKIYLLIPLSMAFIMMLCLVIIGSLLAVMQNALPLALFSITGGFLAPILTSDGNGSHIVLFSYYALLNLGIVGIAWYRSWRLLNLTGFFFTFFITTAWGVLRYKNELLSTTEPFLILFFVFYLAVSILFTRKQTFNPRGMIDATLVFGLPLVAFSLQSSLVHHLEYALAWSAVSLGMLYLILYKILTKHETMQLLREAFLALGIVFFTIAVPYTFSDEVSAALWVLEGAAILWISLRQEHRYAQIFAQGLQIVATLWYLYSSLSFHAQTPFINNNYLGFAIIIVGDMLSAYLLYRYASKDFDKNKTTLFLYATIALWLYAGWIEAMRFVMPAGNVMLIYTAIGAFAFSMIAVRFRWDTLSRLLEYYLPWGFVILLSLLEHYLQTHPFEGIGSIALVLFFSMHYFMLYIFNTKWQQSIYLHALGLWLIALIIANEFSYAISLIIPNITWLHSGWIVPVLILALIIMRKEKFLPAFFHTYQQSYRTLGLGGLMLIIFLWEIQSLMFNANPAPLSYLPFLNPLDALQITGFVILYQWIKTQKWQETRLLYSVLALMVLILCTVVLARSVHAYADISYTLVGLSKSIVFQSALSVLWSIIAMATIITAKSLYQRELWIAGAGLMGVVVLKLFMVELSSSGTIERIVSFIVVGALMLLIGYFAPLPPKRE